MHNHLVREETRTQVALIIESGEPREVMHFALLIGYGASAVNPYLALETLQAGQRGTDGRRRPKAVANFIKAVNKGLLKTFSKMGISTLQSYRGAQVFEAIGLNKTLIDRTSPAPPRASRASVWTFSRARPYEARARLPARHRSETELAVGGNYQYRARGEYHLLNPQTISQAAACRAAGELRRPSRNTPT